MKVTPSDETATYYCGIHSEASLLGIPTATLLRQIASLGDLDERLHTGTEEFTIAETLTPITSYKIVVAGYDGKEFTGDIALSEAFAVEPPAGLRPSPSRSRRRASTTRSSTSRRWAAEVPYFAEVKEAAVCDAMTDDAIISEILNLYGLHGRMVHLHGPYDHYVERRLRHARPRHRLLCAGIRLCRRSGCDRTDQTQVHYRSGGRSHGQHLRLRHLRCHGAQRFDSGRTLRQERPLHLGHRHRRRI